MYFSRRHQYHKDQLYHSQIFIFVANSSNALRNPKVVTTYGSHKNTVIKVAICVSLYFPEDIFISTSFASHEKRFIIE
jgi:hypothetical protein